MKKDSIRITKNKRSGIRIHATGKFADNLFRALAVQPEADGEPHRGYCRKTGDVGCGERECSLGCNWAGDALGERKMP